MSPVHLLLDVKQQHHVKPVIVCRLVHDLHGLHSNLDRRISECQSIEQWTSRRCSEWEIPDRRVPDLSRAGSPWNGCLCRRRVTPSEEDHHRKTRRSTGDLVQLIVRVEDEAGALSLSQTSSVCMSVLMIPNAIYQELVCLMFFPFIPA